MRGTIGANGVLLTTQTRTIATSAALVSGSATRNILTSAVLLMSSVRTISTSATITTNILPIVNATCNVRSGTITLTTRSGAITLLTRSGASTFIVE